MYVYIYIYIYIAGAPPPRISRRPGASARRSARLIVIVIIIIIMIMIMIIISSSSSSSSSSAVGAGARRRRRAQAVVRARLRLRRARQGAPLELAADHVGLGDAPGTRDPPRRALLLHDDGVHDGPDGLGRQRERVGGGQGRPGGLVGGDRARRLLRLGSSVQVVRCGGASASASAAAAAATGPLRRPRLPGLRNIVLELTQYNILMTTVKPIMCIKIYIYIYVYIL